MYLLMHNVTYLSRQDPKFPSLVLQLKFSGWCGRPSRHMGSSPIRQCLTYQVLPWDRGEHWLRSDRLPGWLVLTLPCSPRNLLPVPDLLSSTSDIPKRGSKLPQSCPPRHRENSFRSSPDCEGQYRIHWYFNLLDSLAYRIFNTLTFSLALSFVTP